MPPPYKNPICRGSYLLGSACGHCEKCKDELERLTQANSSSLRQKQASLFESWRAACDRVKSLSGIIQNDLFRLVEDGMATVDEIKKSAEYFSEEKTKALASLNQLEAEIVDLINTSASEIERTKKTQLGL